MNQFSASQLKKHPLIRGTILLTLAGLLSRLMGFFLRIYLSRNFSEEEIGVYQLIAPVLAISFVLTGAGLQTGISRFVAKYFSSGQRNRAFHLLLSAFAIGLTVSAATTYVLYTHSEWIAVSFLLESRTAPLVRILALSVPFSCIHACTNGFCYGIQKSGFPALSQLLEQIFRFATIALVVTALYCRGLIPTISVAVLGILIGEAIAALCSLAYLFLFLHKENITKLPSLKELFREIALLLQYSWPLTLGRLIVNLLLSFEAAQIPNALVTFGFPKSEALASYGILTGMSLPLIMFPGAITGSLSVMLLPHISKAEETQNNASIQKAVSNSFFYCFLLGGLCTLAFFFLGKPVSFLLFHNETAGTYVANLSFLCPFLYFTSTAASILNGLGKTKYTFFCQIVSLFLKLLFVFFLIPKYGLSAYFMGLLCSHILLTGLYLLALRKYMYYSISGNK